MPQKGSGAHNAPRTRLLAHLPPATHTLVAFSALHLRQGATHLAGALRMCAGGICSTNYFVDDGLPHLYAAVVDRRGEQVHCAPAGCNSCVEQRDVHGLVLVYQALTQLARFCRRDGVP